MIFHLILCTTVVGVLYYYFTRTFNYWRSKNVKGPKPIPFFGNFKDVAFRRKHMGMFYWDMYKQYPEEKVVGLYRMTSPTLLIRDLDIAKQVLIKDFEAFPDRGIYFSKEGLGENLFHADSEMWKLLRQRFTPAFTSTKFKGVFYQLVTCGDNLVDYIESSTMKIPEQDVYRFILKYTAGTTMVGAFGLNIDTFNDDNKLFELIDDKLQNSYLNEMDMIFPGFMTKFNLSLIANDAIKFCHQLVEAGSSINNNTINNAMNIIMNLRKEGTIFPAKRSIGSGKQPFVNVSDDLLAAQAWIFYIAGYANNTLLLTYVMYHLARNPDVQGKLREEITEILEKFNGQLTYEALKEMKYLEMIFEETLRMHPLTNGLVRAASRDIKLEGTDITVNKGSMVVVSPYSIQHDEKYFPEPERFNPDRFLPVNVKDRHPCAFVPFGTGPRSCLGLQLARLQFGICVAKVIHKFQVETSKNTINKISYNSTRLLLTPDRRIFLNFVPLERNLTIFN